MKSISIEPNARDLRTISATPLTPYRRGWEDAYYQNIYYNPAPRNTAEFGEYDAGHEEGMQLRCQLANAQ